MRILATTIVRKLPAFTGYSNNVIQYRETGFHNTMIDLDCTCLKDSCSVANLMADHGMTLAFYAETLPRLVRDGYIELTEPETPPKVEAAQTGSAFCFLDEDEYSE